MKSINQLLAAASNSRDFLNIIRKVSISNRHPKVAFTVNQIQYRVSVDDTFGWDFRINGSDVEKKEFLSSLSTSVAIAYKGGNLLPRDSMPKGKRIPHSPHKLNYKGSIQVWTPTKKKQSNRVSLVADVANLRATSESFELYDILKSERKENKKKGFVARSNKDLKALRSERNKGSKSNQFEMMNRGVDNPYNCELSSLHRPINEIERSDGTGNAFDYPRMNVEKTVKVAQDKWDSGFKLNDHEIRVLSEVGVTIDPKENAKKKPWLRGKDSGFKAGGSLPELHQVIVNDELHAQQKAEALSKPFQYVEVPTKLVDAALSDEKVQDLSNKQVLDMKQTVTRARKELSDKAEGEHMAKLMARRTPRVRGGHHEKVGMDVHKVNYNRLVKQFDLTISFEEYVSRTERGAFFSRKKMKWVGC